MWGGYKYTYEDIFYRTRHNRNYGDVIYGFPLVKGAWCNSKLKVKVLQTDLPRYILQTICFQEQNSGWGENKGIPVGQGGVVQFRPQACGYSEFSNKPRERGANINIVQYLGIAADEPERIKRHQDKKGILLPLVEIGWDEAYCRKWCEDNNLLSPIYAKSMRGGCWFCHNQGVSQLRLLRKEYPNLWALLLQWDTDSPAAFHPDGHTVHDFDKRFAMEDSGLVPSDRTFRWDMLGGD